MLKKIECYITSTKLDSIKSALIEKGIEGMSVISVQGFGRQQVQEKKDNVDSVEFGERVKLEIVVEEIAVESICHEIMTLAKSGSSGDGKIFVTPVEEAIRISTAEVGTKAIT